MILDPEAIARDLVRALRGRRSQTAFARRLGYRSNVVYTWESGRRWPDASTFFGAAARVGVDLEAGFRAFHRGEPAWLVGRAPTSPGAVAAFLRDLRGEQAVTAIAARAGRSRFAVSRWLQGTAEPRLPDTLRLVEAMSLRVLDFVSVFADPAALPSTRLAYQRLEAARDLAWSSPWAQAVLLGLELATYAALPAHDDGWLADRLGLDEATVRDSLVALQGAGHVRYDGARFAPVEVRSVDVRSARSGTVLKEFWSSVALDRLRAGSAGRFSYNVFTVSAADLARLDEMQRVHYRSVRALVAGSAPADHVVLLNLQLVPLDRPPPGAGAG